MGSHASGCGVNGGSGVPAGTCPGCSDRAPVQSAKVIESARRYEAWRAANPDFVPDRTPRKLPRPRQVRHPKRPQPVRITTCTVAGCDNHHLCKGLCRSHYRRRRTERAAADAQARVVGDDRPTRTVST